MSTVQVPLSDMARVAHQSAKETEMVQVRNVSSSTLATALRNIPTPEITDAVETGEYVGKSTVQLEGTVEIESTPVQFEITYWFKDNGGAKITFIK